MRKLIRFRRDTRGFTLIELMIVVVIIGGITAALAIPWFMASTTKSKQSEAKQILKQVYVMERAYRQEFDTYWGGFEPNMTHFDTGGGPYEVIADAEHPDNFARIGVQVGPTARYKYRISVPNPNQFTCTATANLDDDPTIDTWRIDHLGNLVCVTDDAAY
ncbi:MAG: type II secretion system protein [Candidatus Aenigmatarchaeota archaeon]